ncbi:MAG TPA: signal recognition particle protein [Gammaproteobacteria bacterium]|nr:signal recognition particle protein [Gammaproteobacteria bacterium]
MFTQLSKKLTQAFKHLKGQSTLSEKNLQPAIEDIKIALLDADVALEVVDQFIDNVKNKSLGTKVLEQVNPTQFFIKIIQDELINVLGSSEEECQLKLNCQPPAVILMAGLQGSGKTTTTAKLAKWLTEKQKKQVMLTSVDIYRPAALEQIRQLAEQTNIQTSTLDSQLKPLEIVTRAIEDAKRRMVDVLIIDTAGRTHIDTTMMDEIKQVHAQAKPVETLFVVDSMTGQDACHSAKEFANTLPLTGIILTKTESDHRGGAALSVRHITQQPIKFIGVGERVDDLDYFSPKRVAGKILDMGDIVSLVEKVQSHVSQSESEEAIKKFKKGSMDFNDFKKQLSLMKKMGGLSSILSMMPGMNQMSGMIDAAANEDKFKYIEAMIDSMTTKERHFTHLLKQSSRQRRITQGSGTSMSDLRDLLKQFEKMKKMMGKMKGQKMQKLMEQMKGNSSGQFDDLF